MTYDEILITIVIVCAVLFAAWRSGQANPVGTGKISRRLSAVELKVAEQGVKIDALDTGLTKIGAALDKSNEALGMLRIELAADRGLTERTWAAVDRLQHFFIEDAFERRGGERRNDK